MGDRRANEDWFRSSKWNPAIADAFEQRLVRARRSNWGQYVRIQGHTLTVQEDSAVREVGRSLLRKVAYAEGPEHAFQALSALENLGDSLGRDGFIDEAERVLREVVGRIQVSPTGRSGTSHVTELALAEVLLARGGTARLREASLLLDGVDAQVGQSSMFRDLLLRFLICRARVAAALGRGDAEGYARAALAVASESKPSMPMHPDLGRPVASRELKNELARIVQLFNEQHPATR